MEAIYLPPPPITIQLTQNADEGIVAITDGEIVMNLPYADLAFGLDKICDFEGFRAHPYHDGAGVPTIGCGTTTYPDGRHVTMSDAPVTLDQAKEFARHYIARDATALWTALKRTPTANQWAAMLSILYNEGSIIVTSHLVQDFNSGNISAAADEFLKWKYEHEAGKLVEVPGLLTRRQKERTLFLTS
jgi:lysozyme